MFFNGYHRNQSTPSSGRVHARTAEPWPTRRRIALRWEHTTYYTLSQSMGAYYTLSQSMGAYYTLSQSNHLILFSPQGWNLFSGFPSRYSMCILYNRIENPEWRCWDRGNSLALTLWGQPSIPLYWMKRFVILLCICLCNSGQGKWGPNSLAQALPQMNTTRSPCPWITMGNGTDGTGMTQMTTCALWKSTPKLTWWAFSVQTILLLTCLTC